MILHHKDIKNLTNENKRGEESSPTSCTPSSPSTSTTGSTSTPKKLRSFDDVYARCKFCIIEPRNFKDANQDN